MLNENSEKVLEIVLRECGTGYKILTEEDFSSVVGFADIIDELSSSGYLSVRFSQGGEYLVAPTYKARVYFEEKQKDYFFHAVVCKKAAVYAFFGALLGGAAVLALSFALWAAFMR